MQDEVIADLGDFDRAKLGKGDQVCGVGRYVLAWDDRHGLNNGRGLSGCRLSGCRLSGRRFSGRGLSGCRFSGCRLSGRRFSGRRLSGCRLSGCSLSSCGLGRWLGLFGFGLLA
ncbi:MAG: pentapeptide repeat-containing protein [Planctomycetes bacterium]|nr:pentapeptide repeat-containing protein [Planctomycetota bacterium]